ncbi:TolC family protein [Burkholderia sp. PAMC 28687]|uniref:TolC family protein n=1 Tax=Burkholderia sp. PAMC 28687 TaxID=1795874 RepID=UPI0009EBA2EA|nr:TolC family protein [Burkholderia sp. PAMC 28687]
MRIRLLGVAVSATLAGTVAAQTTATESSPPLRFDAVTQTAGNTVQTVPLTLDEAQRIALDNNPLLLSARSEADATAGSYMQAGARPNPEVSFLQEGFKSAERTSTGLLSQRIELAGQRSYRLDAASYARQGALASLDGRVAILHADVSTAFYGVLFAQKTVELARDSADIATRSAQLVQRRATAGKVSPVEATRAQVAATEAQIALTSANAFVSATRVKLASTMGIPDLTNRVVTGDAEALQVPIGLSALQQRIEDSPAARRAFAEIGRSNAILSLERARRTPDITVSAGMKRIVAGGISSNQAVVGISIPLPIFDTNRGAVLEARHRAEKASSDRDGALAQMRMDIAQAYASYDAASSEARRLKSEVLPAARQALDATSRGFDLGKFGFIDVLDAQRTLFQTRSQYLKALIAARQAYADLERLVGNIELASSLSPSAQP